MKKKLLWLSLCVPYDLVDHAGGKVHNYYIKMFQASNKFDISLITYCRDSERDKVDLNQYHIQHQLIRFGETFFDKIVRGLLNINTEMNPFDSKGGFLNTYRYLTMMSEVKKYWKKNGNPEIIILQWTQIVLLLPEIKKLFPNSKIVCIEEDISFQGLERKYRYCKNKFTKLFSKSRYIHLKVFELNCLNRAELIVVNNRKDKELLIREGIDEKNIVMTNPYYDDYSHIRRKEERIENKILFYGYMQRKENYLSAIWFIENVFHKLRNKDIEFCVVGSRPNKLLKNYEDEKIKILGFVPNIEPYLEQSMCLVAPLVLGAGIKIKILEGMSAGIPILTNQIGIEGIAGINKKEYFHCETADEYVDQINYLIEHKEETEKVGSQGRFFVKQNFNKERTTLELIGRVNNLC